MRNIRHNSQKRRATNKKRNGLKRPLAVEVERRQSSPPASKQAPVAKSTVTMADQSVRYPDVRMQLRRIITTAAIIFAILIVLYFLLR